jgi:hypothetical protein
MKGNRTEHNYAPNARVEGSWYADLQCPHTDYVHELAFTLTNPCQQLFNIGIDIMVC